MIEIPEAQIGVLGEAQGLGTSDMTPVISWLMVFAGAAAVLGGFGFWNRRKRSQDKK